MVGGTTLGLADIHSAAARPAVSQVRRGHTPRQSWLAVVAALSPLCHIAAEVLAVRAFGRWYRRDLYGIRLRTVQDNGTA